MAAHPSAHATALWALLALASPALASTPPVVEAPADAAATAEQQDDQDEIEEAALAVLRGMSEVLAVAPDFDYHIETAFDVVQQSGTKVEFGASRKVQVSRPNLMRTEVVQRDASSRTLLLDGKDLWVYVPAQKVYARMEQHGDLEQAIAWAGSDLDIDMPLASLFAPDFYQAVVPRLTRALLLDESVLAGVVCDHLLLSNDYTDFQLWITRDSKPVLQRVVITYREAPGEPQFSAQFVHWDLAPKRKRNQFKFDPPGDTHQVRFFVPERATNLDKKDES